ncbi:MAG: periplasmic heavy metal sensor [Desulfomonilia bacterium]|jgi:Spy/CpxP family protein refolding chaperone
MTGKKALMILACMIAFAYPAAAGARGDGVPPGRWWHMPEISAVIELSQAEREALDKLFVQNRRSLIETRNALEREFFELETLLEARDLDEQAAREQFKKIESQRSRLSAERFQYLLEVRKILGHERYARLMSMARDFNDRRAPGPREPMP